MSRRLVKRVAVEDLEFLIPILTGAEDPADSDDNDGTDDGDDDNDGSDGSDDGDDDAHKGKDPRIKELSDENARRRNSEKALKKQLDDALVQLKNFTDKDKSETEKLTGERDELKTKYEETASALASLRLENAFLKVNAVDWHDPALAMTQVDLSGVMDEDGEIDDKKLKAAVENLAKTKPFLVKGEAEPKNPKVPSGTPVGSGGRGSKKDLDRAALEKKYPALRR